MIYDRDDIEAAFETVIHDGELVSGVMAIAGSGPTTTLACCGWNISETRPSMLHLFALWSAKETPWADVATDRLAQLLATLAKEQRAPRLVSSPNAELASEFERLRLRLFQIDVDDEKADAHFRQLMVNRSVKLLRDPRLIETLTGQGDTFVPLLRLISAADLAGHIPRFIFPPPPKGILR